MKKILIFLILFLLYVPLVYGAAGDILSARIDSTGWFMTITIAGADTGGVYDFELGTNGHDPTNAKVKLTVTSQGYDSTGTLGTLTRTIIADYPKRKAYPLDMLEDETDYGTDSVTVAVALQEWIFADDTDITLSLDDSLYIQGAVISAAANDLAVVNASAQPYSGARVIANWAWPGFSRITTTSLTVRATAFHRSAANGKPVEAVKFWVDDKHSHRDSTLVYRATSDTTRGDAVPVTEFVGTLDLSSMTEDDSLVVNFIAYPRVGDEGAILNTSDGVNTSPSPLYCPQIYIYDADKSLGVVAVVDSATGVDANGATVAEADFNPASPPVTYLTIDGAIDDGANIIYMKQGSYAWTGGSNAGTSTYWKEIQLFPGESRNNVRITSQSGDYDIGPLCKVKGIYVNNGSALMFADVTNHVWVDSCRINTTVASFSYNVGQFYFTRNTVDELNAGLWPAAATNTSIAIVRGNNFDWQTGTNNIFVYNVIGNDVNQVGATGDNKDVFAGQVCPAADGNIWAFNIWRSDATNIAVFSQDSHVHGFAMVQNLFERWDSEANMLDVAGSVAVVSNQPYNNALIWHNTWVGGWANMGYNGIADNGVIPPKWRKYWSIKNNIIEQLSVVTDDEVHGGDPDSTRIGNHSIVHGVGLSGNLKLDRMNFEETYEPEFWGLYIKAGNDSTPPLFVEDNSFYETATGGGDYRLQALSPAQGMAHEVLLPFDIQGHPRSLTEAGDIGPYDDYVPEGGEDEEGSIINTIRLPFMENIDIPLFDKKKYLFRVFNFNR